MQEVQNMGQHHIFSVVVILLHFTSANSYDCNAVFLTVSSILQYSEDGQDAIYRELEINWESACDQRQLPDWIGLFNYDPREVTEPNRRNSPLVNVTPSQHSDGYFHTKISMGHASLPGEWLYIDPDSEGSNITASVSNGDHCFSYWVAAFRNGSVVYTDCLKIRPTWMSDYRQQLGPLTLGAIFLPGTHNSACYHHEGSNIHRSTFSRFIFTQDTNIWEQLVYGVRYLDLRVGYYATIPGNKTVRENAYRFWINHDLIRVGPLLPVLRDIKRYLSVAKHEIVVLDLHRFPVGLHGRPSRHRRLTSLLSRELGDFILPASTNNAATTLQDIWSRSDGRRLIVAYGDKSVVKDHPWLWGPLTQAWGNKQTPTGLRQFLQQSIDNAKQRDVSKLWAAMAELTPLAIDIMFNPTGSLRSMADSVNRNVTSWFQHLWWKHTNIVATDFFLGNNLIDVAVAANLRKINLIET